MCPRRNQTPVSNCCQLSRIIWETPDFRPYFPVPRLEYEISPIFTKVFHSVVDSTFRHWTFKYLRCLSYFTVNIEPFLITFGMVYYAIAMYAIMWNITNLWRSSQWVFFAQRTSYTVRYDIIYHHFPINSQFEDVRGWRPCRNVCEAAPVSLLFLGRQHNRLGNEFQISLQPGQSLHLLKSCYTGGHPEQGY